MSYKNVGKSFFRFATYRAFDGQTDGRTAFSWLYRALRYVQSHGNKNLKCLIE